MLHLRWPGCRTSFAATFEPAGAVMFVLSPKGEWIAAILLAVLMAATRIHHFGVGTIAPDASTAVFFLAGLLLGSPWWLAALLFEAVLLDGIAIGFLNVANACISSGYALLAPAYGALWLAGRALRPVAQLDVVSAGKFVCFTLAGTAAFFVISNAGYYFGSEYAALGIGEYAARVSRYFGIYLGVTLAYVAGGMLIFLAARRFAPAGVVAAR
jgi:hypothetical protein